MRSVELFAGAGGLAMGVASAGFTHAAVVERDRYCCDTIRHSQSLGVSPIVDWPLVEADVRGVDYSMVRGDVDLLAGGPPCQPFSLGGKHKGHQDERNMFPEVVRAVRELRPRAIMVENVKGLLRKSFAGYFEYIMLQLTYPEIARREDEHWDEHLSRLERHHTGRKYDGLSYNVVYRLLNAGDYGVPQRRERVFIVGFRSDMDASWSFPEPTHSRDALLYDQCVTGRYWERHGIAKHDAPNTGGSAAVRTGQLQLAMGVDPWKTVRDAIAGLPCPVPTGEASSIANHHLNPGARAYQGHTGSPLDEPAKTLKAGDHGVPGGENMLMYPDGTVRYFTVRESARIQSFPDDCVFHGSWTEAMRQLGNAVPVVLARSVAKNLMTKMERM